MARPGSFEHACELIDLGFAVFPLVGKHPLCTSGFKDAVTNKDHAMELWSRPLSDGRVTSDIATGVGIATGSRSNVWVLDVDAKLGKPDGNDTVSAWVDEHSAIPCAWEVLTPSDGKHLYFKYDPFNPVGTKAGVGPGVDIRGDGGYVVGPGSLFEGVEYSWEFSSCPDEFDHVMEAPEWLTKLVRRNVSSKPISASNQQLTELVKTGTRIALLPNGDEYWRRPGKTRGEHSAVLHPPSETWPEGMLHVFTDSWPDLPEGTYGITASNGSEFLEELKQQMVQGEIEKHADGFVEWDFIDLRKTWEAGPLEPPTVLSREDGIFLCYPGKLNYLFGPSESGKSWAAQVACAQAVKTDKMVVYFDFENDPRAFIDRLTTLDLTLEQIVKFVHYKNPTAMLRPEYFEKVQEQITTIGPALIVIDGISNSMSFVPGPTGRPMSPLVHDDNLYFETRFLKKLLKDSDGTKREKTALIAIDHTPKGAENPTIFGGQHKKAQIDGASFFFAKKTPFGRNMDGRSMICVDKDKPGHVRQNATDSSYIGDLAIYSRAGRTTALIELPAATAGGALMPHKIMEKITEFLKDHPGTRKPALFQAIEGPTQWKEIAVRALKERGYIRDDLALNAFWVSKMYREDLFTPEEIVGSAS